MRPRFVGLVFRTCPILQGGHYLHIHAYCYISTAKLNHLNCGLFTEASAV